MKYGEGILKKKKKNTIIKGVWKEDILIKVIKRQQLIKSD